MQYAKYELAEFGDRSSSVYSQCNNTARPARLMQLRAVFGVLIWRAANSQITQFDEFRVKPFTFALRYFFIGFGVCSLIDPSALFEFGAGGFSLSGRIRNDPANRVSFQIGGRGGRSYITYPFCLFKNSKTRMFVCFIFLSVLKSKFFKDFKNSTAIVQGPIFAPYTEIEYYSS